MKETHNGENSAYVFADRRKYDIPRIYHTHFHLLKENKKSMMRRIKIPGYGMMEKVEEVNNAFGRNIIRLTRRDRWDQFLSYYITREYRYMHSYKDKNLPKEAETLYNTKRHLDIKLIPKYLERLYVIETEDTLKNSWQECPHIYYEDWCSDPLNQLPKVLPELSDIKEYVVEADFRKMNKKIPYPVDKESMFINIDEARNEFEKITRSLVL